MRTKHEIDGLKRAIKDLRERFCEVSHKVDNPPKFKKGDQVIWKHGNTCGTIKMCSGVVSSLRLEKYDSYECWSGYHWRYTVIDKSNDIHTVTEERISDDTPGK